MARNDWTAGQCSGSSSLVLPSGRPQLAPCTAGHLMQMAEAAAKEAYDEAAVLRDRLRKVEAAAAEAADAASQYLCPGGCVCGSRWDARGVLRMQEDTCAPAQAAAVCCMFYRLPPVPEEPAQPASLSLLTHLLLRPCPSASPATRIAVEEPRFALGEMVVHSRKGFRGVVCGWDLACCESSEWQAAAGVRCGPIFGRMVCWLGLEGRMAWLVERNHPVIPPAPPLSITSQASVWRH